MSKLKVAVSILAALLMAAATVTTITVAAVPAWLTQTFEAAGMFLSWQGVQLFQFPPRWSAFFATLNMTAIGFVASHAVAWGDGRKHAFLLVIAFGGAIAGVLARGTLPPKRPPAGDDQHSV